MAPRKPSAAKSLMRLASSSAAPQVPAASKRAIELFAQFKKGKKRAKAQEEAEAMYLSGPNSALCIALAKMHVTLAVEQALKLDEEGPREAAVLACLHSALQYAVTGAAQFRSIQCVVLCIFALHCCRGRGTAEQKAQRQAWHAQLGEALPAGDRAKWAAVGWVDPRLESHATQDRFGFEWNQRGQHPTVEAWAEAVRDDWAKFMHKARVADTIDFKLLERLPTRNPESLRELLAEVETAVERRLAGNVTPLNNADKEALKQRLDALDAMDARKAAAAAGSSSGAGGALTTSGSGKAGGSAAAAAAAAAPPPPSHLYSHQSLTNQWLPALHTAQLNKQKAKAEHKRLVEALARASQRAALIREYLSLKFGPGSAAAAAAGGGSGGQQAGEGSSSSGVSREGSGSGGPSDAQLAASASMTLRELQAAVAQLAASRDLSAAEAELAGANLALLAGAGPQQGAAAGSAGGAAGEAAGGGRRHVWYGDPLLSTGDSRHSVEGYAEMEGLLMEHQRQDWSMFDYAGQVVCREIEGWQAVVNSLPVKPMLLREPCPDLLLHRFSPDPDALDARLYPADLQLIDGGAAAAVAGDELEGGASDDDAFSDALSRQASLGSECGDGGLPVLPAVSPPEQQQQAQEQEPAQAQQQEQEQQQERGGQPAAPAPDASQQQPQQEQQAGEQAGEQAGASTSSATQPAGAKPSKPLLQRVLDALKQQGQLEPAAAAGTAADAPSAGPAAAQQGEQQRGEQREPARTAAEELQALFEARHAGEWMQRMAASWGYSQEHGRQFHEQWAARGQQQQQQGSGPSQDAAQAEFLARLAEAAKQAWIKDALASQLPGGKALGPEAAALLEQMRSELQEEQAQQQQQQCGPQRKKRQRGQGSSAPAAPAAAKPSSSAPAAAEPAADADAEDDNAASTGSSSGGSADSTCGDGGASSGGISWRSGSTGGGASLAAHQQGLHSGGSSGLAAVDILDSYMRELLHNTIPCLDAVLGLYSDSQAECAARLLPEDRLGEVRVEGLARRGLAGHAVMQIIYGLHQVGSGSLGSSSDPGGQAAQAALQAGMRQLGEIMSGGQHPSQIVWHLATSERAAGQVEAGYRQLLELEARSQGRVMSRPVSACTRVLAPLLLQDWEHLQGATQPADFLLSLKRRLGRLVLCALRHLHARRRLMEGALWQLNSYILSCLDRAAGEEAAALGLGQEEAGELGRVWEELADVAHDNQDCFNYVSHLPLRAMLPLYACVALLCAEAFRSAHDVAPQLEDAAVAEASVAHLSPDGSTLELSPAAIPAFLAAAAEASAAAAAASGDAPAALRRSTSSGVAAKPAGDGSGSAGTAAAQQGAAEPADRVSLLSDYAAGLTEAQRAMARLQAGVGVGGMPYHVGAASLLGLGGPAAVTVAGLGSMLGSTGASPADLAERSRLCQQLHRLLYAEAVLGALFQRCEDVADGLEATGQVLRFMAKGLDEFIAGSLSEPLPPAPPLHVEQQLRDAQYALAAADCAQLALMLANERLRAACYADTLAVLREEEAACGSESGGGGGEGGKQQGQQQQRGQEKQQQQQAGQQAGAPGELEVLVEAGGGGIAAAVERFSRLHADMQEESAHDRAALQQLASSLASPTTIPLLKSVDLENVAIVDSVLQFAQNIGAVAPPSLAPAVEQYRSILADKQAEAHERLGAVQGYVGAATRQLEHQRSQLGVLLEWCRIRQLAIVGQLRAAFCAHSALDQLADLAIRAAAVLHWEPELRRMQEQERQANMLALQQELEAEAAEAESRAARAERRKSQQKGKKAGAAAAAAAEAPHANGIGNGGGASSSSSDDSGSEAETPPPAPPQQQAQVQRAGKGSPAVVVAARPAKKGAGAKAAAGGKQGQGQQQSSQSAAYQKMLEEYGLDAEAASFAQQLAAKQALRQQDGGSLPPAAAPKQAAGSASPAGKGRAAAGSSQQPAKASPAVVVVAKRPASAPAATSSSGGGGGGGGNASSSAADSGGASSSGSGATCLVKPVGAKELMRVIGYYGDWLCFCGEVNKLWDTCHCGQAPPCRDWVRGICKYGDACRFSHPPFDLPDGTTIPMSDRISKPAPDAPLYRKGQVVLPASARQQATKAAAVQRKVAPAPIVPAVPAVNAWQKRLQAAAAGAQAAAAAAQQQQQQQGVPLGAPGSHLAGAGGAGVSPAASMLSSAVQTPEPLQAVVPLSADARLLGPAAGGSMGSMAGGGWNPIAGASAFGLGSSSALASTESSRAATPALGGDALAAVAGGASGSGDMLPSMFPFPAAGSMGLGGGAGLAAAARAVGGAPWEQGPGGLGPAGGDSVFLSHLMQGLEVSEDHADADLASLLGPIAADVGGMEPPSLSTASATTALPPPSPTRSLGPSPAPGPSLLDGLAAAQAAAQQQQQQQQWQQGAAQAASTLQQQQQQALGPASEAGLAQRDGGLLAGLLGCLWACSPFRQLVLTWPQIVYKADPVVHALHAAFVALGAAAGDHSAPAAAAAAAELADTLAAQLFGMGPLGEPGEVLSGVFRRIRQVESMRGIPSGVDQCFGLRLSEGVQCGACGKVTRQAHYTQHFLSAPAAGLSAAAAELGQQQQEAGPQPGLGQVLRLLEEQGAAQACDPDAGGCGAQAKLLQLLDGPPRVAALQLRWEPGEQAAADVGAALAAAGEQLDLSQLFLGLHPGSASYRLGALLCCRQVPGGGGTACQAFLLDAGSGHWMAAQATDGLEAVGSWSAVAQRCQAEALQPSLLFYMSTA